MKKGSKLNRDITGNVYGDLKVLTFSHVSKRRSYWVCKCSCGKEVTKSRKNLLNGKVQSLSCGCVPRLVCSARHGLRSWEECVKYKMNAILNGSIWVKDCLIWQRCHDDNGFARTSFLNYSYQVKDLIWFFKNKMTIGKCRIMPICGNRSCVNINHLGAEYYVRRNTKIDRLFEISNNRWEQKDKQISC